MMDFFTEVIEELKSGKIKTKQELQKEKARLAEKYNLDYIPSDADILEFLPDEDKELFLRLLQKKPSRTLSGVAIVSVMTSPAPCPHGKCIYCPGGVDISTPQSYTGREPAAMRGIQYEFDPYEQVVNRIRQLEAIGHATDKIELIIMGGTFPARDEQYQKEFVKGCFDAMNGFKSRTLEEALKRNESAEHRCVGLTVETRPDYCFEKEIKLMLSYGTTRVELGVQNPDDKIYEIIKRGHSVKDVVKATQLAKDSFLKVNYHLMPGLPGSDFEKDLRMFRRVFEDERFKPDMLKIYPCLLVKKEYGEVGLHELYEKGLWKPYDDETAARLIAEARRYFPKWVRVMRIQRDIPSHLIEAGVKSSNLRQLVDEKSEELGIKCRCIRCREIRDRTPKRVELMVEEYKASGGKEFFISLEDPVQDLLIGFLRLRFPYRPFIEQITSDTAGVRELHVYGPVVRIGRRSLVGQQHKGYGSMLLEKAEEIAKENGMRKLLVISGVGVRNYYRKKGFMLEGPYMSKLL